MLAGWQGGYLLHQVDRHRQAGGVVAQLVLDTLQILVAKAIPGRQVYVQPVQRGLDHLELAHRLLAEDVQEKIGVGCPSSPTIST